MSKSCYFCLSKENAGVLSFYGSFHICDQCIPVLKDQRISDEAWAGIAGKASNPETFTNSYDFLLGEYESRMKNRPTRTPPQDFFDAEEKNDEVVTETFTKKESKNSRKKMILKDLALRLKDNVKDQDHVIESIVPKILVHNLEIEKTKPLSFFFAGPTGVGKTELSQALADQLNIAFIKIDMSEYKHSHNISRLIGSPPSYVGYGKPTPFEKVHNKPCVILLDEIEKAHPDIYDAFLQVLDKGVLTTGGGKELDLKEAIVIFTSNLGVREIKDQKKVMGLVIDHEPTDTVYENAVKAHFSPEMINRMDGIFSFNSLSEVGLKGIFGKFVSDLNSKLKKAHGVEIKISAELESKILKEGFNPEMGARPLRRTLEKYVMTMVAQEILMNDQENCEITIGLSEDKVVIESMAS